MAEAYRGAFAYVRLHFLVNAPKRFIRRKEHDDVGRRHRIFNKRRLKSCRLRLGRAAGSTAQSYDHVYATVFEIERLRSPLVAISEDRDALASERGGIDIAVAQQLHVSSPNRSLQAAPALAG